MLPLLYAVRRCSTAGRLLPADVRAAFEDAPASALDRHAAAPAQPRATGDEAVPHVQAWSIASTMPLGARARRGRPKRLLGAPVLEIYGSTETGALAMRRTADETARGGRCDGVRARVGRRGARSRRGEHFASPVAASRRDRRRAQRRAFTLLGRQADLIKIAGRRASLAGLNLLLQDLPGLEDGVFYLPADRAARPSGCA